MANIPQTEGDDMVSLTVDIFGPLGGDRKTIPTRLSQRPQDLHELIKRCLSLPDERFFRLRSHHGCLSYNSTLRDEGVRAGDRIIVEWAYLIEVQDVWKTEIDQHLVYSSEKWQDVLHCNCDHEHRVFFGRERLETSQSLVDSLPVDALRACEISVFFEYQRSLTLSVDDKFFHHRVWSHQSLTDVVSARLSSKTFKYESKDVSASQTFKEIGLQDSGLLSQAVSVAVTYSNATSGLVWVSQFATVADLKQEVMKMEDDGHFSLKAGPRILHVQEKVKDEFMKGKMIRVVRPDNVFEVKVDDTWVRWRSTKETVRFSELCYDLSQESRRKWEKVKDFEFTCEGCGRRITAAEEEYQLLPADCCRVRSLRLKAHKTDDTESTSSVPSEAEGESSNHTADGLPDPPILRHDKATQTEIQGREGFPRTRTSFIGDSETIQSDAEPRPFRLFNHTGTGLFRGGQNVSLLLSAAPTVGEVTAAIALLMGRTPEHMKIVRFVGESGGARVFSAWEDGGIFTSEDGMKTGPWTAATNVKPQFLTDDAASFVMPTAHRLVVHVYRR